MPKNPSGKTKSQRVHALREVFLRWGKLDKQKIDELVAAHLGVSAQIIRKSLYRDLKELVDAGDLVVRYYAPSGEQLMEYDSEAHSNTRAEWALVGKEFSVVGQSALSEAGCALFPLSRLVRGIEVDVGSVGLKAEAIHLFFSIKTTFFCVKIAASSLPATVVVSRTPGPFDTKPPILDIESTFGKRTVLLQVPIPGVSGIQSGKRMGHAVLRLKEKASLSLNDLGSTNGTRIHSISEQQAETLRKSGDLLGKKTATAEWMATIEGLKNWSMSPIGDTKLYPLPAIVSLSKDFQILVL